MSDAVYLKILQESEPDFSEKICEGLSLEDLADRTRRNLNNKYTTVLFIIELVNLWANSCISIDVRLQLSDGIMCLASAGDTMRIVVVHTYDEPTASFVAKGDDIAKDAAAACAFASAAACAAAIAMFSAMCAFASRIVMT